MHEFFKVQEMIMELFIVILLSSFPMILVWTLDWNILGYILLFFLCMFFFFGVEGGDIFMGFSFDIFTGLRTVEANTDNFQLPFWTLSSHFYRFRLRFLNSGFNPGLERFILLLLKALCAQKFHWQNIENIDKSINLEIKYRWDL